MYNITRVKSNLLATAAFLGALILLFAPATASVLADAPWSANVKVNDVVPPWGESPHIAVDEAGNAYALWIDNRDPLTRSDIYFAYRPAGGNWGANVKVNDDTGKDSQLYPDIAVDGAGNAYAIWIDWRAHYPRCDIYFAYRPAGGDWGANERVNDYTSTVCYFDAPAIAMDGSGNAYAVWDDQRSEGHHIYFAYRPAGGNWSTSSRVDDEAGSGCRIPDIAVDAAGNAYAIWADRRAIFRTDIYFVYRPAGDSWGASAKVNDVSVSDGPVAPAIAIDGMGNAYAVWTDFRNVSSRWADIYFAYRPAGGQWGPNVRVNDDTGRADQVEPGIAVDTTGNAYAVWLDFRNDPDGYWDGPINNADIYSAYRPVGGNWGPNERVNDDTGTALQEIPSIAVDGAGNTYAVWEDNRNGAGDIYFAYRPAEGPIQATVDIDPNTLNLKSKGKWIAAYIELPKGYEVDDIDVSTVLLEDTIPAELHPTEVGDYDEDGISDLMVKFDRQALIESLDGTTGEVTLTVSGELVAGTSFEGSDTVTVVNRGR
ncbi:MAG: hypothetical protein H8E47_13720 [Anaerolineales bacterium]|nr:hypothetical protein [Anaerolineales bacterium]